MSESAGSKKTKTQMCKIEHTYVFFLKNVFFASVRFGLVEAANRRN